MLPKTSRRVTLLLDTLRKPGILPHGARVYAPQLCRITLLPHRIVSAATHMHPLDTVEQAVNDALPVSSRKVRQAYVTQAEPLWPTQRGANLYKGVGALITCPEVDQEIEALRTPLRRLGGNMPGAATLKLQFAEFSPVSEESLTSALGAINLALPGGTALPLSHAEFVPYRSSQSAYKPPLIY